MPIIFEDLSRVYFACALKKILTRMGLGESQLDESEIGENSLKKKTQSSWEDSFFREKIKIVNFVFQLRNWQSCFQFLSRERRGFSSENIAKTRSKFIPQFELCKIAPFLSCCPNLDGKRRYMAMIHTHCGVSLRRFWQHKLIENGPVIPTLFKPQNGD